MARIRRRKNLLVPMAPHSDRVRKVACAAIRFGDVILTGPRHWDVTMRNSVKSMSRVAIKKMNLVEEEQGFVDQWGNFMSRGEAIEVAVVSGQVVRGKTFQPHELFSEDYL